MNLYVWCIGGIWFSLDVRFTCYLSNFWLKLHWTCKYYVRQLLSLHFWVFLSNVVSGHIFDVTLHSFQAVIWWPLTHACSPRLICPFYLLLILELTLKSVSEKQCPPLSPSFSFSLAVLTTSPGLRWPQCWPDLQGRHLTCQHHLAPLQVVFCACCSPGKGHVHRVSSLSGDGSDVQSLENCCHRNCTCIFLFVFSGRRINLIRVIPSWLNTIFNKEKKSWK